MPSTRLLSHVRKMVASKDLAFVPWKFRMSVKLLEEHHSSRPAKKARLELTDLLLDDVLSRDIPASGTIGVFHLQQLLSLLSVSLALCKVCRRFALMNVLSCGWPGPGSRLIVASELRAWRSCRRQIGRCGMRSMLCSRRSGLWMMLCTRFAMYAASCRHCFSHDLRFLSTTCNPVRPRGWARQRALARREMICPRSRRLLGAHAKGTRNRPGNLG